MKRYFSFSLLGGAHRHESMSHGDAQRDRSFAHERIFRSIVAGVKTIQSDAMIVKASGTAYDGIGYSQLVILSAGADGRLFCRAEEEGLLEGFR